MPHWRLLRSTGKISPFFSRFSADRYLIPAGMRHRFAARK
jgi:hypothetical protein